SSLLIRASAFVCASSNFCIFTANCACCSMMNSIFLFISSFVITILLLDEFQALTLQQFYQIIYVAALCQKAIDVDANSAATLQDSRREPSLAAALNMLLKLSL